MSKDKCSSIFSREIQATVFNILQIFFALHAVLKIGEYHSDIPQFWLGNIQSRDAFRPIERERKYLVDYKYILLVVLICNIAVHFYELCRIQTSKNIQQYYISKHLIRDLLSNCCSQQIREFQQQGVLAMTTATAGTTPCKK